MKYRITAVCKVEVVTLVEAESEELAIQEAMDREVDICIHGSEIANQEISDDNFCLVDGMCNELTNFEAEEYTE